MVEKIFHVADLHQQLFKRHDESQYAYDQLIDKIQEENIPFDKALIVLAGDLFHQYTNISNESTLQLTRLINNLKKIHKVIIIGGNHDYSQENPQKLDSISPIVESMDDNIIYLKETQMYNIDNIDFALYSIFNNYQAPIIKKSYSDNTVVGLFHGALQGHKTLHSDFINPKNNKTDLFDGCDFVICGDIHLYQELSYNNIPIVYSGSLFQQDKGETVHEHGFIIWDVKSCSHEFIQIKPLKSAYKVQINELYSLSLDEEIFLNLYYNPKKQKHTINPNCTVHILINCKKSEEAEYKKEIRQQFINKYNLPSNTKFTWDKTYKKEIGETSNLEVSDIKNDVLIPKIVTWVDRSTDNKQLVKDFEQLLIKEVEKLKDSGEYTLNKNVRFVIHNVFAKNLLSFSNINLDFNDLKGITCINADNGVGKTHITRLITYLLYNEFYKKDDRQTVKDVYSWYTDEDAYGEIIFELDNVFYKIERSLTKSNKGEIKHIETVYELNEHFETIVNLSTKKSEKISGGSIKSPYDELKSKLGEVKDFLFTTFFDSFNLEKWTDAKQSEIHDRIFRYLGLDVIQKLKNSMKDKQKQFINNSNYLNVKFSKEGFEKEIEEIKNFIIDCQNQLKDIEVNLNINNIETDKVSKLLIEQQSILNNIGLDLIGFNFEDTQIKLKKLQDSLISNNRKKDDAKKNILNFDKNLNKKALEDIQKNLSLKSSNFVISKLLSNEKDNLIYLKENYKANDEEVKNLEESNKTHNDLLDEYKAIRQQMATYTEQLNELKSSKAEVCPKCGEIIDNTKKIQELTDKISNFNSSQTEIIAKGKLAKAEVEKFDNVLKESLNVFIRDINNLLQLVEDKIKQDKQNQIIEINKEINENNDNLQKIYIFEHNISLLDVLEKQTQLEESEIKILENKLLIYNNEKNNIEKNIIIENKIKVLEEEKNILLRNNSLLFVKKGELNSNIGFKENEIKNIKVKIEKLAEETYTNMLYSYYINVFDKDGFPKHIMKKTIPIVEQSVQEILLDIGFDFGFKIEIESDTIKFLLENEGVSKEVKYYSGFEKWMPCMALHMAIMPHCLIPYCNFITFDEIFNAPSERNIPNAYKIIEKFSEIYDTVFIISHNFGIRTFADNIIELEKKNNFTSIK